MKKLLALVVVLLAGIGLAQTITVGVNLELSGRFAPIGNTTLQGIQAALEQSPMADQIELSICDNQTSVEGSVACANRFVDEGVVAVLGAIASSMSIPAAEVLQDAGIIMISTSSTNPATTQIGDHIFRMAYTDDFQGIVAARYAFNDLGARKAAIFRQQDDDYSFGLAGFFKDEFETLGGDTIVLDFVANNVDFSAQLNDLRGFDADIVYYSGFCPEGAPFMTQLRQQGFDQQVLGADASDDPQCITAGGDVYDGFIFTGFGGPEVLSGEAAQRASDFQAFFKLLFPEGEFNGFTLAGADSLNVIAAAIREAGSSDPDAVLAALSNMTDFAGVSGSITYAGTDGTPKDRTIAFFTYDFSKGSSYSEVKQTLFGLATGGN